MTSELLSAVSSSAGVVLGRSCSRSAAQAATSGAAWDVPKNVDVPPPMPVDVVGAPGANRSVVALLLVKQVTWSAAVAASVQPRIVTGPTFESQTAPTDVAFWLQAGAAI